MDTFSREYSRAPQQRLIAILAGGKSMRMGRDKAEMTWRGVSALEKLCREAQACGAQVVVVGRKPPENWPLKNAVFVPDETPYLGPLGGLQSALRFAKSREYSRLLCTACDMPLIDATAFSWLFEQSRICAAPHGVVAMRDENLEPLFAIYSVHVLPLIENRLRENRRSLLGLIERGDFATVEAPPEIAAKLLNLNTPEAWRAAEIEAPREYSQTKENQ